MLEGEADDKGEKEVTDTTDGCSPASLAWRRYTVISMYALYLRHGNRVVVGTMTAASQSSQSQSVSLTWVKRVGLGCCLVQASPRACFETAQIERRDVD